LRLEFDQSTSRTLVHIVKQ